MIITPFFTAVAVAILTINSVAADKNPTTILSAYYGTYEVIEYRPSEGNKCQVIENITMTIDEHKWWRKKVGSNIANASETHDHFNSDGRYFVADVLVDKPIDYIKFKVLENYEEEKVICAHLISHSGLAGMRSEASTSSEAPLWTLQFSYLDTQSCPPREIGFQGVCPPAVSWIQSVKCIEGPCLTGGELKASGHEANQGKTSNGLKQVLCNLCAVLSVLAFLVSAML